MRMLSVLLLNNFLFLFFSFLLIFSSSLALSDMVYKRWHVYTPACVKADELLEYGVFNYDHRRVFSIDQETGLDFFLVCLSRSDFVARFLYWFRDYGFMDEFVDLSPISMGIAHDTMLAQNSHCARQYQKLWLELSTNENYIGILQILLVFICVGVMVYMLYNDW